MNILAATPRKERVAARILRSLEDIQARRYRSITHTHDGTVIIVCAETGVSASGPNLAAARFALEEKVSL